jgi:hypothetical protein
MAECDHRWTCLSEENEEPCEIRCSACRLPIDEYIARMRAVVDAARVLYNVLDPPYWGGHPKQVPLGDALLALDAGKGDRG